MAKRQRNKHKGMIAVLIASIAVINLAGISYSYLNDSVQITSSVSSGDLDVRFSDTAYIGNNKGTGNLNVRFEDDNRTMIVEGTVLEEALQTAANTDKEAVYGTSYSDYEGYINFNILNKGSIPAELVTKDISKSAGFMLDLQQPEASSIENGSKLNIQAGQGSYDFEIVYRFRQK